jgi:glutathione S-transferase
LYKLYYYPGNANLAPHMLLNEIGAKHELVLVDCAANAQKSDAYLKLNPLGRVPTLIDGKLIVTEAAAICLHLTDRHPQAGFAPAFGSDARMHFYKWMMYLTNTLQAELMVYFYPERLSPDAAIAKSIKARAEERAGDMLQFVETELARSGGPYLLGQSASAADFYLLMLARWTRMFARPARDYPVLGHYLDNMLTRAAVQKTFAAEGLVPPLV